MDDRIKVAVVDDFRISRQFFESYVKNAEGYELVRSLPCARDAVTYCEDDPPELLIMDVLMRSGIDGLSAAQTIKKRCPKVRIILATSTAEASWETTAREAGIEGFWYKEYSERSLLEIMDQVMAGRTVYPDESPDPVFGDATRSDLTDRELDVLRELTAGYASDVIAEHLGISVNTVRYHIQNILNKTGFENRLDLAMNAKALGLVVHDDDRTGHNQESYRRVNE